MALATQCPHCHTTFRVAQDQLKLRAGLVRCGACKQIFNGIENLVPIDEVQPPSAAASGAAGASTTAPPPAGGMPVADKPASAEPALIRPAAPTTLPEDTPASTRGAAERIEPTMQPLAERAPDDPLLRMTLLDFAPLKRRSADEIESAELAPAPDSAPDPLDKAINALHEEPAARMARNIDTPAESVRMPAADTEPEAEPEEPRFMRQGRRRERMGKTMRRAMAIGSVVLLLILLVQALTLARNQLAAAYPSLRPTLRAACTLLGCELALPAQIDAVSIESSELQAINPDAHVFSLSTLLRNRGATPQAWPHIELTLTDNTDKAIARRVFTANEYLPAGVNRERGFGPRSEQAVKVVFELSQLDASGYRVYLFYP